MTANADTGATRADTTGNGATSHNAEQSATHHSATVMASPAPESTPTTARGRRPSTPTCGTTASVGARCGPGS
jgi:hypothetical protein